MSGAPTAMLRPMTPLRWLWVLLLLAIVGLQAATPRPAGPPRLVAAPATAPSAPPQGDAVAARLTADDVARGVGALARLPLDHPAALRPEQARQILPPLETARQAHDRAQAARGRARADRLALARSLVPLAEVQP